jgi:hypothetical protein
VGRAGGVGGLREGSCRTYRHAISGFCTHIDATDAAAQDASMVREVPDLPKL